MLLVFAKIIIFAVRIVDNNTNMVDILSKRVHFYLAVFLLLAFLPGGLHAQTDAED